MGYPTDIFLVLVVERNGRLISPFRSLVLPLSHIFRKPRVAATTSGTILWYSFSLFSVTWHNSEWYFQKPVKRSFLMWLLKHFIQIVIWYSKLLSLHKKKWILWNWKGKLCAFFIALGSFEKMWQMYHEFFSAPPPKILPASYPWW